MLFPHGDNEGVWNGGHFGKARTHITITTVVLCPWIHFLPFQLPLWSANVRWKIPERRNSEMLNCAAVLSSVMKCPADSSVPLGLWLIPCPSVSVAIYVCRAALGSHSAYLTQQPQSASTAMLAVLVLHLIQKVNCIVGTYVQERHLRTPGIHWGPGVYPLWITGATVLHFLLLEGPRGVESAVTFRLSL